MEPLAALLSSRAYMESCRRLHRPGTPGYTSYSEKISDLSSEIYSRIPPVNEIIDGFNEDGRFELSKDRVLSDTEVRILESEGLTFGPIINGFYQIKKITP